MKKCEDCKFLRRDIKDYREAKDLPKNFGGYTSPCNRFPMNTMRGPGEPACGEFAPKR